MGALSKTGFGFKLSPWTRVVWRFVHGPWFRGFSNAVPVHVHGLRGIAVAPQRKKPTVERKPKWKQHC